MVAKFIRKQHGLTLVEVVIAAGLLSIAIAGSVVILISTLGMWSKGVSGTSANTYASIAMRKLVLDIEEGSGAVALSTVTDPDTGVTYGTRLQVTFPYFTGTYYSRTQTGSVATYYLSGPNGTEQTGTYLWKVVGSSRTRLAKNVQEVRFFVTNGVLVRINLTGRDVEGTAISPNYLQQSVRLRNG